MVPPRLARLPSPVAALPPSELESMMAPVGITTSSSLYERHFPLTGPIACTLRSALTACVSGAGEVPVPVGGDGLVTARARLPRARARVDTHARTPARTHTRAHPPHLHARCRR